MTNNTTSAEKKPDKDPELPGFLANADRGDWILWWALALSGVYGLAIIPFRAVLLLHHTFLYALLSGSGLSVLTLAANNPDRAGFLTLSMVLAAVSSVKFLPLFYLIGRRWGAEFIEYSFMGHPPRWYRSIEGVLHRFLYVFLVLCFVPFSPLPATILVVVAGLRKANPWLVGAVVMVCAIALKGFYLYLGLRFGVEVQGVLEVVNRYITWITLALLGYMFIQIWYRQRKKG